MRFGVGIFGTEGGSESVYLFERHGKTFAFELSADGKAHFFSEKVLRIIGLSFGRKRQIVQRQSGGGKHLARALAVAVGKNGRMHIDKAAILQKRVYRHRRNASYAENRLEQVGARS